MGAPRTLHVCPRTPSTHNARASRGVPPETPRTPQRAPRIPHRYPKRTLHPKHTCEFPADVPRTTSRALHGCFACFPLRPFDVLPTSTQRTPHARTTKAPRTHPVLLTHTPWPPRGNPMEVPSIPRERPTDNPRTPHRHPPTTHGLHTNNLRALPGHRTITPRTTAVNPTDIERAPHGRPVDAR